MAGKLKLDRRAFLRGTGAAMALPMLECMQESVKAAEKKSPAAKRMLCVGFDFGLYPNEFFPKEEGLNFKMPQLIKPMEKHRKKLTVFSGLDHTGVNGGLEVEPLLESHVR